MKILIKTDNNRNSRMRHTSTMCLYLLY